MNVSAPQGTAFQQARPTNGYVGKVVTNATFTSHRVTVGFHQSIWLKVLQDRFDELTSLEPGWEGYGGRPVSFTCANFAANLLERLYVEGVSAPSLVPGSDGTLQIEWHKNQYDVEIDVLGAHDVVAARYDHLTGTEEVHQLRSDFTQISGWISDLATERELTQRVET